MAFEAAHSEKTEIVVVTFELGTPRPVVIPVRLRPVEWMLAAASGAVVVALAFFAGWTLRASDRAGNAARAPERPVAVAAAASSIVRDEPPPPSEGLELFVWPVPGTDVTSRYGRRKDPVEGAGRRKHRGVDIGCPVGTPVLAMAEGYVVSARRSAGSGLTIRLAHADELTSLYAHLSRIKVKRGQLVRAGQLIGLSGATGRVTGPHLHFEVWQRRLPRNPLHFVYRRGIVEKDRGRTASARRL